MQLKYNKMSKELEFVPYEEALALKELGFNKWVFAYYTNDKQYPFIMDVRDLKEKYKEETQAPLYQQAFRWFREKYNIDFIIPPTGGSDFKTIGYYYEIIVEIPTEPNIESETFKTYEEAELECLRELIKTVKQKNNE